LIPFPTSVLEDYPKEPVAPAIYAIDIAAAAFVQAAMWLHLTRRRGPALAPVTGLARLRPLVTSLIVGTVFLVSVPVAYVWSPATAVYVWVAVPVFMGGVFLLMRRHAPTDAISR
ncbi:MAG TPA: hypothetical protein VE287_03405, partial [Actinopolymorphaceae bacterium]|nr:hypothetical protein [Actinopolymorphaceae bacterium]